MAQYGRPSADTHIGNYEDQAAGTTNIYTAIDETSASDTDYIVSSSAPSSDPYVCALTSVEDPLSSSNHVYRYRVAKSASGGAQINVTCELRQSYVSEASQGTLIATDSQTDIGSTFTTYSKTLSAGEADAITNYGALYLRIVFNQV